MPGFQDVITVDGASGSGKSSLLVALGERYGAVLVEFGPVLRTIAWWARRHEMTVADVVALIDCLDGRGDLSISAPATGLLAASEVVMRGVPMRQRIFSATLREPLVRASDDPTIVEWVAQLVRVRLRGERAVLSGRQAATVVCPEAGMHVRLEAAAAIRAGRKLDQLRQAGLSPRWSDDVRLLGEPHGCDLALDTSARSAHEVAREVFRTVEARLGWRPIACAGFGGSALTASMPATAGQLAVAVAQPLAGPFAASL